MLVRSAPVIQDERALGFAGRLAQEMGEGQEPAAGRACRGLYTGFTVASTRSRRCS
jgi:hypothetical protein